MEEVTLKNILKFGKIIGVVPFEVKIRKRAISSTAFSATLAFLLLVLSADVFGSLIIHTKVPAHTVALRVLISIYTTLVYIFACWVRLAFLEKWQVIKRLRNSLDRLGSRKDVTKFCVPQKIQKTPRVIVAFICIMMVHQTGYNSVLLFQDREWHLNGANLTSIIPSVKWAVMTFALGCKILNGCSIGFSGFLYTLLLLRICSQFYKVVLKLEAFSHSSFVVNLEPKSYGTLMKILKDLYVLRRCLFDLNDISEALCFPVVPCTALLSFNFSHCTITEACAYPRTIEFYRLLQPLMLLLTILWAGSFMERQVNVLNPL